MFHNCLLSYQLVHVNCLVLDLVDGELPLFVLCHQEQPNSIPEMALDLLDHPIQVQFQQVQLHAVVGPQDLSFWVEFDLMVVQSP
jgi:hypothetical protein